MDVLKKSFRAACIVLLLLVPMKSSRAQEAKKIELSVFAAASLTECFNAMAEQFSAQNPEVTFSFNFAGSQQLAQQIAQDAPVDVFVSANVKQMLEAAKSGRVDSADARVFVHNRLVVIFPKENVEGIRSLRDLGKSHLKIILADKAVPVGQYSLDFLDKCVKNAAYGSSFRDEVLKNVVSYEENVRAVLAKVQLGECDAGIVYS